MEKYDTCALMTVRVDRKGIEPLKVEAIAVAGEWAATPTLDAHHKGRYVVTHLPTGFSTGPHMTARDAVSTVAKLRDIVCDGTVETMRAVQAAHPAYIRRKRGWSSPDNMGLSSPEAKWRQLDKYKLPDES